jgi:hypothetical protein
MTGTAARCLYLTRHGEADGQRPPASRTALSRWAKMLMMLQSSVSLVTVVLVVARAVNILQ